MLDRYPGVQMYVPRDPQLSIAAHAQFLHSYGYDLSVDEWGPQVAPVAAYKSRAHFFRYGLGDVTTPDTKPPMYTLKDRKSVV